MQGTGVMTLTLAVFYLNILICSKVSLLFYSNKQKTALRKNLRMKHFEWHKREIEF